MGLLNNYFWQKKCRWNFGLQKKAQIICRWNFFGIAEKLQNICRKSADFLRVEFWIAEKLQKKCRFCSSKCTFSALFLHCTLCFCRKSHFTLCFAKKNADLASGPPPPRDRALQSALFLHFFCTSEKVQIWPPADHCSALFLQSKIPSAKYLHFFCNPPPNPIHTFFCFFCKNNSAPCPKQVVISLHSSCQNERKHAQDEAPAMHFPLRYMPAKNTPGGSFFQIERDSQAHITVSTYGFVVSST